MVYHLSAVIKTNLCIPLLDRKPCGGAPDGRAMLARPFKRHFRLSESHWM